MSALFNGHENRYFYVYFYSSNDLLRSYHEFLQFVVYYLKLTYHIGDKVNHNYDVDHKEDGRSLIPKECFQ